MWIYFKKLIPGPARAMQLFQLLRQGSLIVVAIFLANSGLSKEEIGFYELLLYLAMLLTSFWVSGGVQGMLSVYPKLSEDDQAALLGQSWLVFVGLSAIVAGLCWWQPPGLLPILVQRDHLPYLSLFAVFLLGNTVASLQEYYYLLAGKVASIVLYGLLSSGAQVLAIVLPLALGYGLETAIGALATVGLAKGLWSWGYVQRYGRWEWSVDLARRWWMVSWPLIVYALLGVLNLSVGPWLVNYFFSGDSAAFAVYRYGARELPLLGALLGGLSSALIPLIAARPTAGMEELRLEMVQLGNWLFPVSILLLLTSPWWFVAVFDAKFADSVPLFMTFLLTTPLHFIFARTLLIALADTRMIPFLAGGAILLHLLLGWWLGTEYGMLGIAGASVLSFGVEKLTLAYYLWHRHRIAWSSYTRLNWLGMWTLALFVAWGVAMYWFE